ncbi:MAG: single-stranded DNA-binding protein [Cytophagales bacterium]|nr:single-stranded DNA-binding protein [Bernardetiaceae bacterium]MDW8204475.1 single-stranded DNA-binding protein [Cytophagales bacterium]
MVNKAILIGNLGKDPIVRHTANGIPVATFSLATSEVYKDESGERIEKTEWHNIVLWRGLAEVAEKYLKKGMKVYIEGKITNREYEQDGVKKYITEIVGNNMQILTSRSEATAGDNTRVEPPLSPQESPLYQRQVQVDKTATSSVSQQQSATEDELPF